MIRLPPRSTRTDTLFPSTTLFRSDEAACKAALNPENPAAQPNPYRVFDHLPKIPLPTKLLDAGSPTVALMHGGLASLPESQLHPPQDLRSEEHTSELQSLMRISYAVLCLKKKTKQAYKTNIY